MFYYRPREQMKYKPPSDLEQRVQRMDSWVGGWLARLQAYLTKRWPALGRWLAD